MASEQTEGIDPASERVEVHIDLDKIGDIALVGIRRAAFFMGFGLNAIAREDVADYSLGTLQLLPGQFGGPIHFLPDGLPPDVVAHHKQEFGTWVVGCGFRDMLEHYATMLDQMHRFALAAKQANKSLGGLNPEKEQREFHSTPSVKKKVDRLINAFGIVVPHAESIAALTHARNCLTHDLGVVTDKRCVEGKLVIKWLAPFTFFIGDNDEEVPIMSAIGKRFKSATSLNFKFIDRTVEFRVGERLILSHQDLSEILFFFSSIIIPGTISGFAEFLRRENVPARQS